MDKCFLVLLFFSSKNGTLLWLAAAVALFATTAAAQPLGGAHVQLLQLVDKNAAHWWQASKQIWDFAELGYHETKSSDLLQEQLKAAGFKVQAGVANEPTAFIASYGEGKPVVAILGEFDALPGLSQQTVPTRDPVKAGAAGKPRTGKWTEEEISSLLREVIIEQLGVTNFDDNSRFVQDLHID